MVDDDTAFGTATRETPVTRGDFERALRALNASDVALRDMVIQLAARVVTLTDELTRRLDHVEPAPAAPHTAADPPAATVEDAVTLRLAETLAKIRASDAAAPERVSLDTGGDKYTATPAEVPCAELIPLCEARCCKLTFSLSPADLDEGVIRWDYGQPYLIRQRASDGYCVHNDPTTRGCSVHSYRPRVCRTYDCRKDKRIWLDYDNRVVAPLADLAQELPPATGFDLLQRAKARSQAMYAETQAINTTFADAGPRRGPRPP